MASNHTTLAISYVMDSNILLFVCVSMYVLLKVLPSVYKYTDQAECYMCHFIHLFFEQTLLELLWHFIIAQTQFTNYLFETWCCCNLWSAFTKYNKFR